MALALNEITHSALLGCQGRRPSLDFDEEHLHAAKSRGGTLVALVKHKVRDPSSDTKRSVVTCSTPALRRSCAEPRSKTYCARVQQQPRLWIGRVEVRDHFLLKPGMRLASLRRWWRYRATCHVRINLMTRASVVSWQPTSPAHHVAHSTERRPDAGGTADKINSTNKLSF